MSTHTEKMQQLNIQRKIEKRWLEYQNPGGKLEKSNQEIARMLENDLELESMPRPTSKGKSSGHPGVRQTVNGLILTSKQDHVIHHKKFSTTHSVYRLWRTMFSAGLSVCEEWHEYTKFAEANGEKIQSGHSLSFIFETDKKKVAPGQKIFVPRQLFNILHMINRKTEKHYGVASNKPGRYYSVIGVYHGVIHAPTVDDKEEAALRAIDMRHTYLQHVANRRIYREYSTQIRAYADQEMTRLLEDFDELN